MTLGQQGQNSSQGVQNSLPSQPSPIMQELRVEDARVAQFDLEDFPTVRLFVSVSDYRGIPLKNLKFENFEILENNKKIENFRFADEELENLPLSILFIIDVSGSMQDALDDEIEAVKEFISNLSDIDRVALVKFSDAVIIEREFSPDKGQLLETLKHLYAMGQTRLYDAIYQGISLMLSEGRVRKAIIVLSDGLDNRSVESSISVADFYKKDVLEKNQSFSIFTLGLGEEIDVQGLAMIADMTGGRFFHTPTAQELKGIYQTILEQILSEYIIAYESQERRKGALIEGKVNVSGGGGKANARFIFRSPGLGSVLARLAWPGILIAVIVFIILVILTFSKFMRAAWVTVMIAPLEGKDFALSGDVNLIGRAEDCNVRIRHDPGVLPHHAEIRLTKDGFVIRALSEDNLPLINGVPMKSGKLTDKSEFMVGNTRVIMHERRLPKAKVEVSLEELISAGEESTSALAGRSVVDDGLASKVPPSSAVVSSGPHSGYSFDLKDGLSVGRVDADILFSEDRMVSRKHAKFHLRFGANNEVLNVMIEDLGSTNGTYVNGVKIPAGELRSLSNGDVIRIGASDIRLL